MLVLYVGIKSSIGAICSAASLCAYIILADFLVFPSVYFLHFYYCFDNKRITIYSITFLLLSSILISVLSPSACIIGGYPGLLRNFDRRGSCSLIMKGFWLENFDFCRVYFDFGIFSDFLCSILRGWRELSFFLFHRALLILLF